MKKIIYLCLAIWLVDETFAQPQPLYRNCEEALEQAKVDVFELRRQLEKQQEYTEMIRKEKDREIVRLHKLYGLNENNQTVNLNAVEDQKIANYKQEINQILATYPETFAKQIDLFNNYFDAYVVDLSNPNQKLKFFWKDRQEVKYRSLDKVRENFRQEAYQLTFATNGGMYDPNHNPKGLLVQDGATKQKIDKQQVGNGNFYLQPNGVFLINKNGQAKIVTTQEFLTRDLSREVEQATQSGPMLVINGAYHDKLTPNSKNKNLRSGVGIINNNRVVFIISKLGVNFYDFARLFKEVFGCENALFLDGAISQMYCPELKRYDNGGPFGTIIGLVK